MSYYPLCPVRRGRRLCWKTSEECFPIHPFFWLLASGPAAAVVGSEDKDGVDKIEQKDKQNAAELPKMLLNW